MSRPTFYVVCDFCGEQVDRLECTAIQRYTKGALTEVFKCYDCQKQEVLD